MILRKLTYFIIFIVFLQILQGCFSSQALSTTPTPVRVENSEEVSVNDKVPTELPEKVPEDKGNDKEVSLNNKIDTELPAEDLAKKGYDYWTSGEYNSYDEAVEYFKAAIEKAPDNGEYQGALGRALFDMGKEEEAKEPLEKSLELKNSEPWVCAWSHIILGQIYEGEKNYDLALKHYKAAADLKATKNSTKEASGRVEILSDWKRSESDHFIFNYPPGGYVENNLSDIISRYEKAYKNISEFLQTEMPGKIVYYCFPSRESGMDVIGYELGFCHPANKQVYAIMGQSEQQTTGHEMTHVISFYIASTINSDVLIHEGLAESLNQNGEDFHGQAAYLMKEGTFVSLKELRKDFRSYDTQLSYNEAASFVLFLIETYGIEKFKQVWAREDFSGALPEVYGKNYDELGKEWEDLLKKTEPVEWQGGGVDEELIENLDKELEEELRFLYDPNFPFNEEENK